MFSQKNVTDSLLQKFISKNDDSVKINLLNEILEELANTTNDSLLGFYENHKQLISVCL